MPLYFLEGFSQPEEQGKFGPEIAQSFIKLLQCFLQPQSHLYLLRLEPNPGMPSEGPELKLAPKKPSRHHDTAEEFIRMFSERTLALQHLEAICTPSHFNAYCIARQIVLRYQDSLQLVLSDTTSKNMFPDGRGTCSSDLALVEGPTIRDHILIDIGLNCLFDLLSQLENREPQLCVVALSSLSRLLEAQPAGQMAKESKSLVNKLFALLVRLRNSSCEEVAILASTNLISLAVAACSSELLLEVASVFLCLDAPSAAAYSVPLPDNYRTLHVHACYTPLKRAAAACRKTADSGSANWMRTPFSQCHVTSCELGLSQISGDLTNSAISPETGLAMTTDGQYIYLLHTKGLLKIGTGCGETKRGYMYHCNELISAADRLDPMWLAVHGSSILMGRKHSTLLWVLDSDTLHNTGEVMLPPSCSEGLLCSVGNGLRLLKMEDASKLSIYEITESLAVSAQPEVTVTLTKLRTLVFGENPHLDPILLVGSIKANFSSNLVMEIKFGKEVALLRTQSGQVFYAGKGSLLGVPDSWEVWTQLILPESISRIYMAHGGSNALFLSKMGAVFFAGTATRGEDGDPQMLRRPAIPVKCKRMYAAGARRFVAAACNSGTTALVGDNGQLYLHGKDAGPHCSPANGQLQGLDNVTLTAVALGKTHGVVLSKLGCVYTFGMNNFGQCGRADPGSSRLSDSSDRSLRTEDDASSAASDHCVTPPTFPGPATAGDHNWLPSFSAVCPNCLEESPRSPRSPYGSLRPRAALGARPVACVKCGLCPQCAEDSGGTCGSSSDAGKSHRDSDSEGKPPSSHVVLSPKRLIVKAPINPKITHVSCGNYHTLLLSAEGQVFSFGSNRCGQLGVGDCRPRMGAQAILLPGSAADIACGANHSVIRSADNLVYTFGKHNLSQLGREGRVKNWFATPGLMDGFEPDTGNRAIWIGASGDLTFVHFEEPLMSKAALARTIATGNERYILLFAPKPPNSDICFAYLVLDQHTGCVRHHTELEFSFSGTALCLDAAYDTLWAFNYDTSSLRGVSPWLPRENSTSGLKFLKNPEFWLPTQTRQCISQNQVGLSVLALSFAIFSRSQTQLLADVQEVDAETVPPDSYQVVDRFQGYGGGWGYSAQSVEAIQFMCERDITILGVALFGGRGQYSARLRLLRVIANGPDGEERNWENIDESDELAFECPARDKCHLFFRQPAQCSADVWYVIWASISGPSSDCGSRGQSVVMAEDGAVFHFRNSTFSNNGTDVHGGQISAILFTPIGPSVAEVVDDESNSEVAEVQSPTEINVYSMLEIEALYGDANKPQCFSAVLRTLSYATQNSLQFSLPADWEWKSERLISIAILSVNILKALVNIAYPRKPTYVSESVDVAIMIEESFVAISGVLQAAASAAVSNDCAILLLEECMLAIVNCFHAFFPTPALVKNTLTRLLTTSEKNEPLLCAILRALANQHEPLLFLMSSSSHGLRLYPALATQLLKMRHSAAVSTFDFVNLLPMLMLFIFYDARQAESQANYNETLCHLLQSAAADFNLKVMTELVHISNANAASQPPTLLHSPSRFGRTSATMSWDPGQGTWDAIAFQIDVDWVTVHGVGIYRGIGSYTYSLELMINYGDQTLDQWQPLEKVVGTIGPVDENSEIAFLKFYKPVQLTPHTLYAFKLQMQGGKAWSGENGTSTVHGFKSARFTFGTCSLSTNGTTLSRGQFPTILYSVNDKMTVPSTLSPTLAATWFTNCLKNISQHSQKLFNAYTTGNCTLPAEYVSLVFEFLQRSYGLVSLFLENCPVYALEALKALDELLPLVSSINSHHKQRDLGNGAAAYPQIIVESEHPYMPSQMNTYIAEFPRTVCYMCLEFDVKCNTSQSEDNLQVYLGTTDNGWLLPVAKFYGTNLWPKRTLLIPGNCVWFMFETAANYTKAEPASMYGFKCTVTGMVTAAKSYMSYMQILECELAHLSAYCCNLLLARSTEIAKIVLPSTEFDTTMQDDVDELIKEHGTLLRKGLRLHSFPTIYELHKNEKLPPILQSAEILFLKDFIQASTKTTGGKLARWLMPDSYIDLSCGELLVECDRLQSGQPVLITMITKEQRGRVAYAAGISISIMVTAVDGKEESTEPNAMTLAKSLVASSAYQPTYLNKARYLSITMMKGFDKFSFEELRMAFFSDAMHRESLQVSFCNDGTYLAQWVPRQSGTYKIECSVDGYMMPKTHIVEVSNGRIVSKLLEKRPEHLSRARMATVKACTTQGIRIRVAPNLFAEVVGIIPRNGTIFYVDELENNDGIWLRLNDESALAYCAQEMANPTDAWCLQYHKALEKTLMLRETAKDDIAGGQNVVSTDSKSSRSVIVTCEERYLVLPTPSPLDIKTHPTKTARIIGVMRPGEELFSVGWLQNSEGIWIQLHRASLDRQVTDTANNPMGFCCVQDLESGSIYLDRILSPTTSGLSNRCSTDVFAECNEAFRDERTSTSSAVSDSSSRQVGTQTSPSNATVGSTIAVNVPAKPRSRKDMRSRLPKPIVKVPPIGLTPPDALVLTALSPSVVDAMRSTFAALLWHEGIVQDTMACASYLKFHPELLGLFYQMEELQTKQNTEQRFGDLMDLNIPEALRLLHELWVETFESVQTIIRQHLILPSPPLALRPSAAGDAAYIRNHALCELCDTSFPTPVTLHMKLTHAGCGGHSGGQGYNSLGKWTSGWTGNCGEGGLGSMAAWYLLCFECRQKYLRTTETFKQRQRRRLGRFSRLSSGQLEPQRVLKNNSLFLLELNGSTELTIHTSDQHFTSKSDWGVNLFPQTVLSPLKSNSSSSTSVAQRSSESILHAQSPGLNGLDQMGMAYASDPGPKRPSIGSISADPNDSSWPVHNRVHPVPTESKMDAGSQNLISSPSTALQRALSGIYRPHNLNESLKRPVFAFVMKQHDLDRIRDAIKIAITRSVSFAHSFQVLSWLLKTVTLEQAKHVILWHFIDGLSVHSQRSFPLTHPMTITLLAGPYMQPMLFHFHSMLYNVSALLAVNKHKNSQIPLLLKTWQIRFTAFDHPLILRCKILQILCRILADTTVHDPTQGLISSSGEPDLRCLENMTTFVTVDSSSRKSMIQFLLDGTTETFWESGDEDKNCGKWLYLTIPLEKVRPMLLAIHVDNCRDVSGRVSQITIYSTFNRVRHKLLTQNIDVRFAGWFKCVLNQQHSNVQIEMKSTDASLRVRQLAVYGYKQDADRYLSAAAVVKRSSSYSLHLSAVKQDAFSLFELIASEAFDVAASTELPETALRNQLLELALGKDQLHSLQQCVVRQIFLALERESTKNWENSQRNASYIYGLICMLDRLCDSGQAVKYLVAKRNLLRLLVDALALSPAAQFHTITLRVLKKLLPLFDPLGLDTDLFLNRVLMLIAKAMTVQVKEASRGNTVHTVTASTTLSPVLGSKDSWKMDWSMPMDTAQTFVQLLQDMAQDNYGNAWSSTVRVLVATHVLSLSFYNLELHYSTACLTHKGFWLCQAALLILQSDSWLRLSPLWKSMNTRSRRFNRFCDNHDDGNTIAYSWCGSCAMNLCRECNAVFHMSRRTQQHNVKLFSGMEESLHVQVHDGCGRLKLSWIMILADSKRLNAIVEFREEGPSLHGFCLRVKCRFCGRATSSDLTNVCENAECKELNKTACTRLLNCGHYCGGVVNEKQCLACLHCHADPNLKQDSEDMCMVCFTDTLSMAPSIQLTCGHIFHFHCVKASLTQKWPGPRITFGFMLCPICKAEIDHPSLEDLLQPLKALYEDVSRKAVLRLEYEGQARHNNIVDASSPFYQDVTGYALDRYAYYICFKCQRAYFGGEAQCQAAVSSEFDPTELLCGGCSDVAQAQICPKHGTDFLEYKCRYCCSIAIFFCFGTTHFCAPCHEDFQRITQIPQKLLPQCPVGYRATQLEAGECPLRVSHPPTGEEFSLGCGVCRNIMSF